jgi:hypothetical protein
MHRSPSTQLRTPEFPRFAVASSFSRLALSFHVLVEQRRERTSRACLRSRRGIDVALPDACQIGPTASQAILKELLGKELARRWGEGAPPPSRVSGCVASAGQALVGRMFSHFPGQPRELTDDLLPRKHDRGHSFPLKHLFNVEAEDMLMALLW